MSLNWKWNESVGFVNYKDGRQGTLYIGNAFIIALDEYIDSDDTVKWSMGWFAVDEQHMKNLLGLSKDNKTNYLEEWGIESISLNINYKECQKLINLLVKAKMQISIYTYTTPW